MAKTKKRIEKAIESFDKLIKEHEAKIEEYQGNKDYLIPYWGKQIDAFKKAREKEKKKLVK